MFWHPAVWRKSAGFRGGLLSIATPIIVSLWHVCPCSELPAELDNPLGPDEALLAIRTRRRGSSASTETSSG